jgi:hypothetical protein
MSRSLLITRTDLSLADLQLWSPPNSFVVGDTFGPGAQVLRRETVTSPFVRGRFVIAATADSQDSQILLQICGSSGSDLSTRVGVVLDAFGQLSYTLTWNFDGITSAYFCEAADYTIGEGGRIEDIDMVFHTVPILLTIPHDPLPISGTF